MSPTIRPALKLEELVNENGDIVYRPVYRAEVVVIQKNIIDEYLNSRPLDNTTVWEIISAWEKERMSLDLRRLVLFPCSIKSLDSF